MSSTELEYQIETCLAERWTDVEQFGAVSAIRARTLINVARDAAKWLVMNDSNAEEIIKHAPIRILELVRPPTEREELAAVQSDGYIITEIREPHLSTMLLALERCPEIWPVNYPRVDMSDQAVQLELVRQRPGLIRTIEFRIGGPASVAAQMAAVYAEGWLAGYLKEPCGAVVAYVAGVCLDRDADANWPDPDDPIAAQLVMINPMVLYETYMRSDEHIRAACRHIYGNWLDDPCAVLKRRPELHDILSEHMTEELAVCLFHRCPGVVVYIKDATTRMWDIAIEYDYELTARHPSPTLAQWVTAVLYDWDMIRGAPVALHSAIAEAVVDRYPHKVAAVYHASVPHIFKKAVECLRLRELKEPIDLPD